MGSSLTASEKQKPSGSGIAKIMKSPSRMIGVAAVVLVVILAVVLGFQPIVVLQDKFIYQGRMIRAITYRADFAYFDRAVNRGVIEDVKGMETDVFKIKKKMFLKKYGDLYEFRITR